MEFEELGSRCSVTTCRQHDFLPFTCANCSNQFCGAHHVDHNCHGNSQDSERIPLICPSCKVAVRVIPVNFSVTERESLLAEHVCLDRRQRSKRCEHVSCRARPLVPVRCPTCLKTFCISHRSELDHDCLVLNQRRAAKTVLQKIDRSSPLPPPGYTNSPLKPRGDANIEGALRAYYEIEINGSVTFWFFNRKWSVAKVVEQLIPGQRACAYFGESLVSQLDQIGSIPQHSRIAIENHSSTCAQDARMLSPSTYLEKVTVS